ncbi:hypothetical protein VTJ04DRAFT_7875 [Mycothermus thermophilus]|uniref:uncharacterized protein n=1 Tax=Humicola insolens TaxID=85995 RepID=UPI003742E1D3
MDNIIACKEEKETRKSIESSGIPSIKKQRTTTKPRLFLSLSLSLRLLLFFFSPFFLSTHKASVLNRPRTLC